MSGDHEKIRLWRLQQALGRTFVRRPDLIKKKILSSQELTLLQHFLEQKDQ